MSILVTGGCGYIGSHTVCELLNDNNKVIIVDNLCNSKKEVLSRIEKITGKKPIFYEISILDEKKLEEVFQKENITSVIHFAGLKSVKESVLHPEMYHHNNVDGSIILFNLIIKYHVKNIVFSSSATVYGKPKTIPVNEDAEIGECFSPYAYNKVEIENCLIDLAKKHPWLNVIILRYFNPIGAHPSGLIGEDPNGIPNNLMPYISQVAIKKLDHLDIFGNDYNTIDGTGVRDYIHVMDLAKGHILSLNKLLNKTGVHIYNLGRGEGVSVLQLVHAFEKANNIKIPYQFKPRRPGDIDIYYADVRKAHQELGFQCKYDIIKACKDSFHWQSLNPNGYN